MKGFVLGRAIEGQKLWRRLSVPQRVSSVGISTAVALGLTWMALEARAPAVRPGPDGETGIQVASRDIDAAQRVLRFDGERGEFSKTDAPKDEDWLFEENWLAGPFLHGHRLADEKRRRVQEFICWAANIKLAGLEIDAPMQSPLRKYRTEGSATVTLFVASGVERLTAREVGRVRRIVCGAYGLSPEVVMVTDNVGNPYGVEEDDSEEDDERYRANLEKDIRELISGLFAENEFKLVVRSFQPRPARYGSGIGGLLVGGNFGRIDLSLPREASIRTAWTRSTKGAIAERGVTVVVNFGAVAVRRLLETNGGSFRSIDEFKAGQRQAIQYLAFPHVSHVSVLVNPLTEPPSIVEVSGGPGVTLAGEGEGSWRNLGLWQDWLERNWPFVAMVSAVLIALIGAVAVSRRRVSSGRGSSLKGDGAARRSLSGKAGRSTEAANSNVGSAGQAGQTPWRLFAGRADGGRADARDDLLTGANGQDSLLSATDRMSEWVRERPQTAASVLRVWLAQPSPVSEADDSGAGGPS